MQGGILPGLKIVALNNTIKTWTINQKREKKEREDSKKKKIVGGSIYWERDKHTFYCFLKNKTLSERRMRK